VNARSRREGYTLFELLIVMALLIILGAVVIPNTTSLFGGNRPKAAADQIRGELAAARSWAMEEGVPYRVAVSGDGTKIRRGPDGEDFGQGAGADSASSTARIVEYAFEKVIATVTLGAENERPGADAGGWVTIAVYLPDGTCRDEGEANSFATVQLREDGLAENSAGLRVIVQKVTGQVRVTTGSQP
jgi:Tfp pilus assembly protein FimT